MAWHQIGDKPLSEPTPTQIHWRIYAALGEYELKRYILNLNRMNTVLL